MLFCHDFLFNPNHLKFPSRLKIALKKIGGKYVNFQNVLTTNETFIISLCTGLWGQVSIKRIPLKKIEAGLL